MTPTAPNNSKQSDPRIVSPSIKVVYPSQSVQKDLSVSIEQNSVPTPQILQTTTASVTQEPPTKEQPIVYPTKTQQEVTPVTNEVVPVKPPTWKDTMKEHAQLFIAVAIISIGIGILIGKKI